MTITFSNTVAVDSHRQAAAAPLAVEASSSVAGRAAAPSAARSRTHFRCAPLEATISVQQCRANRARFSAAEALELPFDVPPWWVQPLACASCTLAPRVEAGQVPFFTAEEVLAGKARAVSAPAPAPATRFARG